MQIARRTAAADDDLPFIARDNETAATRLSDRIERSCGLLARNPLMGRARPELRPELRFFAVGRYVVLYRAIDDGIEVVRVLHSARHLPSLL